MKSHKESTQSKKRKGTLFRNSKAERRETAVSGDRTGEGVEGCFRFKETWTLPSAKWKELKEGEAIEDSEKRARPLRTRRE